MTVPDDSWLREILRPESTAIIVVDVQNDFCVASEFPAAATMLPRLKRLLTDARTAGLQVIYTQVVHSEVTDSEVWRSRYARYPHRLNICRPESKGVEIHPTVAPQPNDIVVVKHRYNAFLGTNLNVILQARKIRSLVFTGIATEVCVTATAREAFSRDYWTIVVSDCTATHSDEAQLFALRDVDRFFGRVIESEEISRVLSVPG